MDVAREGNQASTIVARAEVEGQAIGQARERPRCGGSEGRGGGGEGAAVSKSGSASIQRACTHSLPVRSVRWESGWGGHQACIEAFYVSCGL